CGSAGTHRRNRRRGGRTGPVECAVRYPAGAHCRRTGGVEGRGQRIVRADPGRILTSRGERDDHRWHRHRRGDAGGHPAESLRALAAAHHLPVLAEPSSPLAQARGVSSTFVPAHARVLGERTELRDAIRTVVVHGKPTLTRPVAALLADETVTARRLPV